MTRRSGARASPERAYRTVVDALGQMEAVAPARLFGAVGLKVAGRIFVLRYQNGLVVRLPSVRVYELVAAGVGAYFRPRHGRAVGEWVWITGHHRQWLALANEAMLFARRVDAI